MGDALNTFLGWLSQLNLPIDVFEDEINEINEAQIRADEEGDTDVDVFLFRCNGEDKPAVCIDEDIIIGMDSLEHLSKSIKENPEELEFDINAIHTYFVGNVEYHSYQEYKSRLSELDKLITDDNQFAGFVVAPSALIVRSKNRDVLKRLEDYHSLLWLGKAIKSKELFTMAEILD